MTHLVVIVADTLREPSGVPGYEAARVMPFLSDLERRGQVYPQFVASAPWTIPSHVSLLTGREPWSVVYRGRSGLGIPGGPSLADAWRAATGGESLVWSCNGLISPAFGTTPGYDHHNLGSANRYVARSCARLLAPVRGAVIAANGLAPPAGLFEDEKAGPPVLHPSLPRQAAYRGLGAFFHTCSRALLSGHGLVVGLERYLRRHPGSSPRHILLNFMEAHEPYVLHPSPDTPGFPSSLYLPMMSLGSFQSYLRGVPPAPGIFRRAYLESLRRLDDQMRETFRALERGGMLCDALVVFVSDHGQSLGDRGAYGHGNSLSDELLKVPCAVWRFRDGKPLGPTTTPSAPFDHRHLHEAIRKFMSAPEGPDLTPYIEEALRERGPAVAFQEGSPSVPRRRHRDDVDEGPIRRALRVLDGRTDTTFDVEAVGGRLRPAEASGPQELREKVRALLGTGREGRRDRSSSEPSVDRRLSAWGYV